MPTRRAGSVVAALALVTVLAGCSDSDPVGDAIRDGADRIGATKVKDCANVAKDVASVRIDANATQQQAEEAARKLDERVKSLEDEDVRAAAQTLKQRIDELRAAVVARDRTKIDAAAQQVRDAAKGVADTCNLPLDRLIS